MYTVMNSNGNTKIFDTEEEAIAYIKKSIKAIVDNFIDAGVISFKVTWVLRVCGIEYWSLAEEKSKYITYTISVTEPD